MTDANSVNRPSWDEYGMLLAQAASKRAACSRRQVGAAILSNTTHSTIATGYNGVVAGQLNCSDGGCPRGRLSYEECPPYGSYSNCVGYHAEFNAIFDAQQRGQDLTDCTLYVTHDPCEQCTSDIERAGIIRVISPNSRG